jgi:hypothetical protein
MELKKSTSNDSIESFDLDFLKEVLYKIKLYEKSEVFGIYGTGIDTYFKSIRYEKILKEIIINL